MLGFITRAVFGLEIIEKNGIVRISGIRADQFIDDINKTFGTTRVTVNMFNKATRSYIEFYSFFLIDVEYIVRTLAAKNQTRMGKRGYVKMHEMLLEKTWLSNLTQIYPSIFNKDKIKEIKFDLLPHQTEFIDYYNRVIPRYNLKGMLMAATPGSGKTISSIAVACAYESKNVIVISPKNAVFKVWEDTLLNSMAVKQTVWVQASGKPMPQPKNNRWFIFHYESLDKAVELANSLTTERCTVILDESHNLNEMKSLRTERFVTMCRSMSNSLIVELSGTPMKAMGAEAIPLISAIDPLFTDRCVEKFKKIYGREAKAATAILANRLGIIMYKVNKEESKIQEPVEHTVQVKVPNASRFTLETIKRDMNAFIVERTEHYKTNRQMYHDMYYNALREFEKNTLPRLANKNEYDTYTTYVNEFKKRGYDPVNSPPKALFCNGYEKNVIIPTLSSTSKKNFRLSKSVVKYVNLKIRGECLGTVLSRARMDCNLAVLQSLDLAELIEGAEKKTLVFTSYVEIVKAAAEKLKLQGYSPLCVYAETNAQLPTMVKQFGEDESINPMIATYQSLSTAVPLIMANRVVLLNAPFRIHEKEQTVARANRLGQDKTVDVFNVLLDTGTEPNISTRSNDIMEWSREQVNAIMGFDNTDNSLTLESNLQADECISDINQPIEEEEMSEIVIENQPNNQPSISFESEFKTLMNEMNTSTNFTYQTNDLIDKGFTLNKLALEMYATVSPSIESVSLESHTSSMMMTVVSLEQEKTKRRSILSRLLDLLKKLFEALMEYLTDASRQFNANIYKAKQLKRHIGAGKANAFKHAKGVVKVSGAMWLTRGDTIDPQNHIRDMEWQCDTSKRIVNLLSNDFSKLSNDFNDRIGNLSEQPGLNVITPIVTRLRTLTELLPDAKSIKLPESVTYKSTAFLGGRQFTIRYPVKGDSAELVRNYSMFHLKTGTVENFKIEAEAEVKMLNRPMAEQLLDIIIDNNRRLTHINSFVGGINKEVTRFIASAQRLESTQAKQLDDRQMVILTAQLSMMIAGIKGLATYTKEFANINNKSSKASLNYILNSANGMIEQ